MKKLVYVLLICVFATACDDGDVIFTSFDFEDINLQHCGDVGDYVFFKINNENAESLSLQIRAQDSILHVADTVFYTIDATTHRVFYRKYDGELESDYFCNAIPATSPQVTEEYISSAGEARVITKIVTDTTENGIERTYTTQIRLQNLRMENNDESIVRESLILGVIERSEIE